MFFMNEAHEAAFAAIYLKEGVDKSDRAVAFMYLVSCIKGAKVEDLLNKPYTPDLFEGDEALLYECALNLLGKDAPKHQLKDLVHLNNDYMQVVINAVKIASDNLEIIYGNNLFGCYMEF